MMRTTVMWLILPVVYFGLASPAAGVSSRDESGTGEWLFIPSMEDVGGDVHGVVSNREDKGLFLWRDGKPASVVSERKRQNTPCGVTPYNFPRPKNGRGAGGEGSPAPSEPS